MEWDPRGLRAGPELGAGCWAKGLRGCEGTRDVGWMGHPGAPCPAPVTRRAGGVQGALPLGVPGPTRGRIGAGGRRCPPLTSGLARFCRRCSR